MKKLFFTLAFLLSLSQLSAQLNFSTALHSDFAYLEHHSIYTFNNQNVTYSFEFIDNKDGKFTIYNDDLSINRTFTITDLKNPNDEKDFSYYEVLGAVRAYNSGYDTYEVLLTQTLFNDDDKFEIIRPIIEKGTRESGSAGEIGSPIETETYYYVTSIQIISEDGTILGTLPEEFFESEKNGFYYFEFYLQAFTLGKDNYLYLSDEFYNEETEDYESYITIYSIDKNGSNNISKKNVVRNSAYPNPVKPNNFLTIELDEESIKAEGYIEITDLSGRVIERQAINGRKEIKVSTRKLRRGQYIYNIISDNNKIDSGKIIVQ